jgi:hypothetical protein
MSITIHIPSANPEEIVRGLLAAQAVFDKAGVTPLQAAEAQFDMDGWDIQGFEGEGPDNSDICDVWREADVAAVKACCEGWPKEKVPDTAELELSAKTIGDARPKTQRRSGARLSEE